MYRCRQDKMFTDISEHAEWRMSRSMEKINDYQ